MSERLPYNKNGYINGHLATYYEVHSEQSPWKLVEHWEPVERAVWLQLTIKINGEISGNLLK